VRGLVIRRGIIYVIIPQPPSVVSAPAVTDIAVFVAVVANITVGVAISVVVVAVVVAALVAAAAVGVPSLGIEVVAVVRPLKKKNQK
jgi:hypothetical protein